MSRKDRMPLIDYPVSEHGNFFVKYTIGVLHPYCFGPRHVQAAEDHHGGILDETAIKDAEAHGALAYEQHETVLLIGCKVEIKDEKGMATPELHQFLLAIKAQCEKDGYAGFAFVKA